MNRQRGLALTWAAPVVMVAKALWTVLVPVLVVLAIVGEIRRITEADHP